VNERIAVVFDVNVFVTAVADCNAPRLPKDFVLGPIHHNPGLVALAVVKEGAIDGIFPCSLYVSRHILLNIVHVLRRRFQWSDEHTLTYVQALHDLCTASGGGYVETPRDTVTDVIDDYEDNRILELALHVDARIIVSNDHHLTDLSPWRGRPILPADHFALRAIDARRRASRTG
jgi:predicted nucleic acid-binding protein